MADSKTGLEKPGVNDSAATNRRWLLALFCAAAFHLSYWLAGGENGLWVPALGVGLTLTAWAGYWILPLLALDALFVAWLTWLVQSGDDSLWRMLVDSLFLPANIGLSWWVYQRWAGGSKQLDDPRSATLFLIIVPGLVQGLLACVQALFHWMTHAEGAGPFSWAHAAGTLWISRALGSLIPVPVLLVVATPLLVRHRWLKPEAPRHKLGGSFPQDWTWGEIIETAGLTLGNCILAVVLVLTRLEGPNWYLWGIALLVVVWASLRQGLRGGTMTSGVGASLALTLAVLLEFRPEDFSPLQGNLLAQCSTALLVGASSGWIRASEARYRQVVGHIPVVLYSSHLPRGLKVEPQRMGKQQRPGSDPNLATGPGIVDHAEITLVSSAAKQVFGCEPEALLGPFHDWLARILPADQELVVAAVSQLCRQKEPVTCEYRLDPMKGQAPHSSPSWSALEHYRCVRDTMSPHYTPEGLLGGWEGVVEDITEQQALSLKLRRTTNMLQALITNLPAGVFFVQGTLGQPILVNARARQLLGQREDRAAGIAYLSQVYRLHRPDGTLYPADQLPVAMALRQGTTHMVNDIVIHHPDGRRVPLITWAAPVDLTGNGKPDAAVWVLEDMTSLQQAEKARRDTETRLREAMEFVGQSKEKYQNLVETLPLMVLQLDAEGKIIFLNAAVERLSGYTAAELRHPGFWESLLEEEDRWQFQTARTRTLSGYHARVEFRFLAKDGTLKVGHALMQPMVQDNQVAGTTCLVVDMTLQRFLEGELQKAQQLELVARLASGTVHDFNNLVTVMVGLAGLAKVQIEPGHAAQEPLGRIHEVGEQASHLIGQILAFSKQRSLDLTAVDLNAVVRHCLKILHGVLPQNISVETSFAEGDEDLLVKGDETQFKQIVINLCLNAREAMPEGGKLFIRTDVVCNPTDKRLIRLTIQDTGHGMTEAVLARIFEPFFSTKERGTGLGLTVVRQIVESFGGRIEAWSQPLQGTRIEILLKEAEGKPA